MKKIIIVAAVVLLCVAAVLVYTMRGDITGKLIQSRIESALENSPYVDSWAIDKTTYKDGRFDMSGLEMTVKGNKVYVDSISAEGVNKDAKTADMLVVEGIEISTKNREMDCVIENISIDKPDFSGTQAQLEAGNYFTFMGYEYIKAIDMYCTGMNNLEMSISSYDASGPVMAGVTPAVQRVASKNIIVKTPVTQFKIPEAAAVSTYDEASRTARVKYEPMHMEGLFVLDMEFEFNDFDPVEMNKMYFADPLYTEELELTVAYANLKIEDSGAAQKMFSTLGAISGMNPNAAKNMVAQEIASSTAFEEMFQNGTAIKAALLDYIGSPRSIEFIMMPPTPVTISLGSLGSGDSLDFLEEYNISISVNGRPHVKIR